MAVQSVSSTPLLSGALSPVAPQKAPGGETTAAQEAQKLDQIRRAQGTAVARETAVEEATAARPVNRQELDEALAEVRKVVEPVARNLQFSVDEDTGRTVVKVVDSATKEVIRQIPSEEILSIAKALDKLKGLLIKQEA